jgi:hypothetical protein
MTRRSSMPGTDVGELIVQRFLSLIPQEPPRAPRRSAWIRSGKCAAHSHGFSVAPEFYRPRTTISNTSKSAASPSAHSLTRAPAGSSAGRR